MNFIALTLHDGTPVIFNKSQIATVSQDEGDSSLRCIDLINAIDDGDYWNVKEEISEIMELLK